MEALRTSWNISEAVGSLENLLDDEADDSLDGAVGSPGDLLEGLGSCWKLLEAVGSL